MVKQILLAMICLVPLAFAQANIREDGYIEACGYKVKTVNAAAPEFREDYVKFYDMVTKLICASENQNAQPDARDVMDELEGYHSVLRLDGKTCERLVYDFGASYSCY